MDATAFALTAIICAVLGALAAACTVVWLLKTERLGGVESDAGPPWTAWRSETTTWTPAGDSVEREIAAQDAEDEMHHLTGEGRR